MNAWKRATKNPNVSNISVWFAGILIGIWFIFHIWQAAFHGPPPPDTSLDPMIMLALGAAVQAKSMEKRREDKETKNDITEVQEKVQALEDVAAEAHPEVVAEHGPPLTKKDKDDLKKDKAT